MKQSLNYAGKILENGFTLYDYNIKWKTKRMSTEKDETIEKMKMGIQKKEEI